MKLKQVSVAAVCIGTMLTACQKEQPLAGKNSSTNQLKSDNDIAVFFADNRQNNTQVFPVDAQSGGEFTANDGTQITIQPSAFLDADGGTYNGIVHIELLEIYRRSQMLINNMPTESTDGSAITTGGAFNIVFRSDEGVELGVVPGGVTLFAPGENTGGVSSGMTLWNGVSSTIQTRDIAWENTGNDAGGGAEGYDLILPNPGQHNIDEPWTGGGGSGTFSNLRVIPTIPELNEETTEIFVSINGARGMLTSLDVFAGGYWRDNNDGIPFGESGNIIAVTTINGELRARIIPFVANQDLITIQLTGTNQVTVDELQTMVDALP